MGPSAETTSGTIQYDWDQSIAPSIRIVEAVAATTGDEPTEISMLQNYIDPDALDSLLRATEKRTRTRVRVSFEYDGIEVTADSDTGIQVRGEPTDTE